MGKKHLLNKAVYMAKRPVFYSFSYRNDVFRVQQIRNIGSLVGNTPVSPNAWETIKRTGEKAVQKWIDENLKYKQCVIVLVGEDTATRPWVKYEIKKAWNDGKPIFGIYIHNLKCPRQGRSRKGKNPFDIFTLPDGRKLSSEVICYDPMPINTYSDIASNIEHWIDEAIENRKIRSESRSY